jgi:hypothetical protein
MALAGYVLDTSALIASFYSRPDLEDLLADASAGRVRLYLPTVALADAESELHAGTDGWAHLLYEERIVTLALSETCALEVGSWPGTLAVRHAAHEALALRAVVVTLEPKLYNGLGVAVRLV